MRLVFLFTFAVFASIAGAGERCSIHLVDNTFGTPQVEFTRQFVQGALPTARDVTMVRLADLESGVRAMGYTDHQARSFVDVVARTLQDPVVRDAPPDSALGRAARRLALVAHNPRAVAACLVHQACSDEVLFLFSARQAVVSAKTPGRPGHPTFAELIYENVADAPAPYGLLLIEPKHYASFERVNELRRSLLSAMGTYDVLLTLHEWAIAQTAKLKSRRPSGLLTYLQVNRDRILIDEGFAHILMFAQGAAIKAALVTPNEAKRRGEALVATVQNHPKARRLARRLSIDTSAEDLIRWSERTMQRLYEEL